MDQFHSYFSMFQSFEVDEFSAGETASCGQIQIGDMAEGRMGCQAVVMRLPAPGRS